MDNIVGPCLLLILAAFLTIGGLVQLIKRKIDYRRAEQKWDEELAKVLKNADNQDAYLRKYIAEIKALRRLREIEIEHLQQKD